MKEKQIKQLTSGAQQQKGLLAQLTSDNSDAQRKLKRNELRIVSMEL